MVLPHLDARQLLAPTNGSSFGHTLAHPVSSVVALSTSQSTLPPSAQLTTVTVVEIIYLAASSPAASAHPSTTRIGTGLLAEQSGLASAAAATYDGLTFMELAVAFASLLLVFLVLTCFAAFFLRQAAGMRRLMEESDEEALSDVGLGGVRERKVSRARGREGERRGLMRSPRAHTDSTSDSNDGDEDVKL